MQIERLARNARDASAPLASAAPSARDAALFEMADALEANRDRLLEANATDISGAEGEGVKPSFIDRLRLTDSRLASMTAALREVASFATPLGRIEDVQVRPNGLRVGRMRIPLGVIAIIYEARPNVTSDAASLCLKAGNATILKGGRYARGSNEVIVDVMRGALERVGLPPDAVQYFGSSDREQMAELLTREDEIDLVIPRGGERLIRFVAEHSRIPVLKHYKGVCHVYLDESADETMAVEICHNAKVQRPSVCNSLETLLVNRGAAERLLPAVAARLTGAGVTLHGCDDTRRILTAAGYAAEEASEDDYYAEYLSLDLAVRVVDDLAPAAAHIRKYGSDHTEAIVTQNHANAMAFINQVHSSTVLINASTRFADGGQLGLGAEVGISTTKLHSFGPMGLEDLTSRKFVVFGDGQVRS